MRSLARFVETEQLGRSAHPRLGAQFRPIIEGAANGRAIRHGFSAAFANISPSLTRGPKRSILAHFPRSRAIPPPRILSDEESIACRHAAASRQDTSTGRTLTMLVGLLASTGLRSGEALRLDRADVDLGDGVLHIRKTKFRKDRLVPVHATTLAALRQCTNRDAAFPAPKDHGFFLSSRGVRLRGGAPSAFGAACELAGLNNVKPFEAA